MHSLRYNICRILEDRVSIEASKRFSRWLFDHWTRPTRKAWLSLLRLFRPEERKLLAGAWKPAPATTEFLQQHFGFNQWEAIRGVNKDLYL